MYLALQYSYRHRWKLERWSVGTCGKWHRHLQHVSYLVFTCLQLLVHGNMTGTWYKYHTRHDDDTMKTKTNNMIGLGTSTRRHGQGTKNHDWECLLHR